MDRCTGVARLRLDDKPNIRQQMVTSKIRDYVAQIQTHNLDLIGQALHFARHAVAVTGKATRNNRRLETNWEEVAVQAICPPPTGGFHLFDGERDPAVPMDSPVTASAAVLVPRQVAGGPARNTRSAIRRARVSSDAQVVSDAHAVATPVANDNIGEGVNPSWNGIHESDWNGINDDDLRMLQLDVEAIEMTFPDPDVCPVPDILLDRVQTRYEAAKARRASFPARDANNIFEPRRFTCLADVSKLHSCIRELRESREPTPTSPTSSFLSVPETFDSNENTPQNSHSELTPEVALYCGALQFE